VAPFFDPESSPALDALRRDCLEELQNNFPLSKDARTCAVVLVCGDMRVESADWLALVLAIDRLERDGVLFVKPLETAEDERSLSETPRTARAANPRRPTRLRVAVSAPAQTLPAAAVMDCLRFENKPPPGRAGATGAARRRSAVPPADADREALRAEYVFSPGPELRNRLLRKHSGGSDGFDGTSPRRVEDEDDDEVEVEVEDDDENEVEVDDEVEVEAAAAASASASASAAAAASASASASAADGAARRVFDTRVFGDGSPDAVTTFEGTSRQTRRRRKRPRSGSAAPAPVALRRQTQQKSGSEALRDALAAASVSGAMTLRVPVGVVAATLAELDELRAKLDRAETRA
jgi:hypothetical protein